MNKPKIIFFDVDGTLVPLKAAAAAHCRTVMEDGIYWYCLEQGLITT